jgi:lysophospholipase L1-like esterase
MRARAFGLLLMAGLLGGAALPSANLAVVPLSRDLGWWKARFAAKQAELRQGPVELAFYGDSITQDYEMSFPEAWRNFAPVWQHYYTGRHAVNLGFSGDATSHLLWRIENGEAAGIHPKAAVVLIGANNFGHLHWGAAATAAGIDRIVAELHKRLPGTKILLIGVLPCLRGAWVAENTATVNRMLAARYGDGASVTFMDLTKLFLRHGMVQPDEFVDPHLHPPAPPLHPDPEMQARMAAAIEPVLARMLGDRPRSPL